MKMFLMPLSNKFQVPVYHGIHFIEIWSTQIKLSTCWKLEATDKLQ